MQNCFDFADALGPAKIIHVHEPSLALRAILVVDNVARGPSIGGVRMAEDVSVEECVRLARAMTFKNASADLPHGGGKAVLFGDPKMDKARKESLIRGLARVLRNEEDYIFAPDMGTDEQCMAWVRDEIGRAVGLPTAIGGIPLDEIGATGLGLAASIEVAAERIGMSLEGARVAVQGFGAVGRNVARFLTERGCLLIAAVDSGGGVVDHHGLDVDELAHANATGTLAGLEVGDPIERDAIVGVECDIWIPAARPNVLHADNVDQLHTRIVAEGANIPATPDAEARLHERGILVLPDFIANAGGVICGAVEYAGGTKRDALTTIDERIRANTAAMLDRADADGVSPRAAAAVMARDRLDRAMSTRRFT